MRELLDFLYEHSLDELVYCALAATDGELQLSWRAVEPLHWEVRHARSERTEQVPRADLVGYLGERGADLVVLERELSALVAAHVVVADQLLKAAHAVLGSAGVNTALQGQQQLVRQLREALASLSPPRLRLVR